VYIYSNRKAVAAAIRGDEVKMFTWDMMLHLRMARGAPLGGCAARGISYLHTARGAARGVARGSGRVCAVAVVTSAGEASAVVTEPGRAGQGRCSAA
jgi:hypothetical protein